MKKIAIITDTHFGCRGDNPYFLQKQKEFLENVFFPTIKKERVDAIVHMGDLFDNRIRVNINTLAFVRDNWYMPIRQGGYAYYQIVGNHDCYRKDSNSPNLPALLSHEEDGYSRIIDTFVYQVSDTITLVPWINNNPVFIQEITKRLSDIQNKRNHILLGHFQIEGCKMPGNQLCEHGTPQSLFKDFKQVLSGHFHNPSVTGNIHYTGNPFFITWADYGDNKGFYIMDAESHEMKYYENPDKVFHLINIDDNESVLKGKLVFTHPEQTIRLVTNSITNNRKKIESLLEELGKDNHKVEVIENAPEELKIIGKEEETDEESLQAAANQSIESLIETCVSSTDNLQSSPKELSEYLINLLDETEFNK